MTVKELIEKLQKYNPEARVGVEVEVVYSELTSGSEWVELNGLHAVPYGEDATCEMVEFEKY